MKRAPLSLRLAGSRTIAWLLALGVALLLVAIFAAVLTMGQVTSATESVEHTLRVQSSTNRLAALNEQIETGRRGYLIQPDSSFQTIIGKASDDFAAEQATIAWLVSDNSHQGARINEIAKLHDERSALMEGMFLTPATAAATAHSSDFNRDRGVLIARRIRALTAQMVQVEDNLLSLRNRSQVNSLVRLYLVGGAALLLLVAVLGTVIVLILRYNRDLSDAERALRVANTGLEAAVATRTAELVRANQEIQRFAYIVSHDLRSPLVNVLGFTAELDEARKTVRKFLEGLFEKHPGLRDEAAWVAVDEDLPEALGFIRASTEKMDRLINSILQLSRQGRRQLSPEALDMEALADGVAATLYQRASDAGAAVIVEKPLPAIESDRVAVEQVLSNLVENAIKYRKPAEPVRVTISGSREGATVHIDVTDNGRGIDPRDHERIFELFRRSGLQDQPGEGIGLANVRALAYRLGGTIEVQSELDRGSRFRLSLPAQFTATESLA